MKITHAKMMSMSQKMFRKGYDVAITNVWSAPILFVGSNALVRARVPLRRRWIEA
jgi:hypothetical protein